MSSEAQTMKSKRALTPKLRFPEFRDAPGWEAEPLGSVSQFVKKKAPLHQLNLDTYVSTENLSPDYGGIEQASKLPPSGSATEYKPDDILIANIRPYLKKVWRSNRSGGASNDVIVIRPKAVLRKDYLPIAIANDAFINYVMKTAKGVKMPRGDIASMKEYIVYYPSPAEQQKIADCLSSLDGLIVAEGRKLAALRDHKRGLMQQLFPQPGHSQPRLRFPKFRDEREWCVDPLGELFDTTSGGTPNRGTKGYWGGSIPWITTSLVDFNIIQGAKAFITEAGLKNSSAKLFPKNTVLVAMYGQGKTRGKVALLGVAATSNQACAAILPGEEVDPVFTFLSLSGRYDEIRRLSNSGGQENLSQGLIRELPFCYPKDVAEQECIATCLTVLDTHITAQAAKIDVLKSHKLGLMQQLFPAAEGK